MESVATNYVNPILLVHVYDAIPELLRSSVPRTCKRQSLNLENNMGSPSKCICPCPSQHIK